MFNDNLLEKGRIYEKIFSFILCGVVICFK